MALSPGSDMLEEAVSAFGMRKTIREWLADPLCLATQGELVSRLLAGWRPEKALTEANQVSGSKHSQFKGVTWDSASQRWRAQIKHEGRVIFLGKFIEEIRAARAYDAKCRELRGLDAEPNFDD